MRDADHRTDTVVYHGVSVEKGLNVDDFAVPSLVFEIRAPSDRRTTIRIEDPVPDSVSAGDLGFHPKHGGEFWSFDGDLVVFTRPFEPGEAFTTVYGVVDAVPDTDDWLLAEPTVSVVPDEGVEPPGEAGDGPGAATDAVPEAARSARDDSVLERLVAELGTGDVDDADRRIVLEALFDGAAVPSRGGEPGEDRARTDDEPSVDREQSDDETAARASRPTSPAEALGAEIDDLCSTVQTLSAEVENLDEAVESLTTGTRRNARDIDDVGAELAELVTTVESLAGELGVSEANADPRSTIAGAVESMGEDLDEVLTFRDRIVSSLESHAAD